MLTFSNFKKFLSLTCGDLFGKFEPFYYLSHLGQVQPEDWDLESVHSLLMTQYQK
jgi:hypothetical protein